MLTIVVIQSFMHRLGLYIYMQRKSTFIENQSTESTYGTCLFYLSYTYSYICSHYLSIADSLKRFSYCCIILSLGVAYNVFVINIFYQYKKTNEWWMNFRHPRRNSATSMIMTLYMWTLLSPILYLLFTARYMYLNQKFNNTHIWKCSIFIYNSWIFFVQNEKGYGVDELILISMKWRFPNKDVVKIY